MEEIMTTEQTAKLRKEFQAYLKDKHSNWSDSTVSTIISDSFFTANNNVGIGFWDCFIDEKSLKNTRDKIETLLLQGKKPDNANVRADDY